jgi:hypothetical protein
MVSERYTVTDTTARHHQNRRNEYMKTQIEFVREIIELSEKHPSAQIKLCVDGDEVEEYGWTAHEIRRVELLRWVEVNEQIYTDEKSAKYEIQDMLFNSDIHPDELKKQVDDYFEEHAVDAICVFTYPA